MLAPISHPKCWNSTMGLPRNFHAVTPRFPHGNAEISTALPQLFLGLPQAPCEELTQARRKLAFRNWENEPILLCYPGSCRMSSGKFGASQRCCEHVECRTEMFSEQKRNVLVSEWSQR